MKLKEPSLIHVLDMTINLNQPREMGKGRAGNRRIISIAGGVVVGPKINGRVLDIGADWQTVFESGLAELDTRYALETDDGAIIEVKNFGHRFGSKETIANLAAGKDVSPSDYYMRTHARLETGDQRYDWVNNALFIGTGARLKESVVMSLFEIK